MESSTSFASPSVPVYSATQLATDGQEMLLRYLPLTDCNGRDILAALEYAQVLQTAIVGWRWAYSLCLLPFRRL